MSVALQSTSCLICDSVKSEVIVTTSTMMGDHGDDWNFHKCVDCNMVYLTPRVPESELDKYYTESYLPYRGASAWGKYSKLVEQDQKKIDIKRLNTVQKYISENTSTLLDIGCGKPTFLKLVDENTDLQCVGLDFSNEGWKQDIEKYSNLKLHVGSTLDLPKEVKADVITMWHYLEHDYNPKKTLRSLAQTQNDNALLVIEVPNHDAYTRTKYRKYWSGYHSPRHTGLYTLDTMKKLLDESGWQVVDQYTYGTLDPYTLDWMSRMEQKSIDWSQSMEPHFFNYVLGKILRPRYYFHRMQNLGFMTTIARRL